MLYTKDNIKYCLLSWDRQEHEHIEEFTNQEIPISGLYSWSIALKGDRAFPRTPDEFEKYNLVHINVTAKNLPLIAKILPLINRNITKILLNIDYSIELWSSNLAYPQLLLQEIDKADYIFAVEDIMAETLSTSLKRKVPCIPHPAPIHLLETLKKHERLKKIMVSIHRYDMNTIPVWFACNNALNSQWKTTCIGAFQNKDQALHLFDEVCDLMKFDSLMRMLSNHYAIIDSHTLRSYGRINIEAAALGVPCISSNLISSQRKLFPELTTQLNDVPEMSRLLHQLIKDNDFYTKCVKYAIDQVSYYSYENCVNTLLKFING